MSYTKANELALTWTLDEIEQTLTKLEAELRTANDSEVKSRELEIAEYRKARKIVANSHGKMGRNVSFLGFPD